MTDEEIEKYIAEHQEEPQPNDKINPRVFQYVMDYKSRHIHAHVPAWYFFAAGVCCKVFCDLYETGKISTE